METELTYRGRDNLEVMKYATNYNQFLVDLVAGSIPTGTRRLLDFGAGVGTFAEIVAAKGFEIVCLEPDAEQLNQLSKKFKVKTSLSLEDQSAWDYIYSLNVLEHIEDDTKAIDQIFKSLKVGGRLMVYLPAFQMLYSSMDEKVGHFRRYKKSALVRKMKVAGFKISRAEYVDSMGFFVSLIYKYIGASDGSLHVGSVVFFDRYIFPMSRFFDKILNQFFGKNLLIVAEK